MRNSGTDWRLSFLSSPKRNIEFKFPRFMCANLFRLDQTGVTLDQFTLDQIRRRKTVILDTTSDPVTLAGLHQRREALQKLELETEICWVTDDLVAPSRWSDVAAWPDLLWGSSKRASKSHPAIPLQSRRYLVSCLNRMFRPHRAYLVYQLKKKSYFEQCLITHRAYINSYTGESFGLDHDWFSAIPRMLLDDMSRQDLFIDDPQGNGKWPNDHSYVHPAYTDCYLNIVTESMTEPGVYLTEKIFKPLAAGQLFMILGNQHSVQYLKNLGIECFDQDLDAHRYDLGSHWIDRADQLLALLDNIYCDIEDIYWKNLREIQHNQEWVLSDAFRSRCLANLRDHDLI